MGTKEVSFRFNDKAACLKNLSMWLVKAENEGSDINVIADQIEAVTKSEEKTFDICIYKHGYNGFDIERNLRAIAAANTCYRQVDGIQVTTDYLAGKMREHNENIFVLPNCLDFKLWDAGLRFERTDKQIRILWSGGSSHLEDLMVCRDALKAVLDRHPECVFVCAGFMPEGFSRVFDSKQIETVPWCDFKEHPYRLHRLRPDIGIIPLRDSEFARCKSPIKWTELSALAVPCVVSNSVVYNTDIKQGETGYLFDTPEQFTEQIETLIKDTHKRKEIGDRACAYVKDRFDIDKWAPKLLRWYEGMWLKKNITCPDKNLLTPVLKARWEKEVGHPINSVKAVDGAA
jgi:glycosyltransferase involved in cell wall biosynthesis